MKRSLRVLLAAVAILAALCSSAWAADDVVWDAKDSPYVVSKDVTIGERIKVSGDFTLILNDGFTLNAEKGITVASTDQGVNSLTIEGGPEGTGKLIATSGFNGTAAIGGGNYGENAGKITINGGVVEANAYSGSGAAAIGGGDDASGGEITINGGVVTAMNSTGGSFGAAIGGGQSNTDKTTRSGGVIKITGGVVTARAFNGAAIGGGAPAADNYSAYISGGSIIMTGGIIEADSVNGDGIGYGAGSTGTDRGTLSSDQGGRAWIVASSIMVTSNDFKVGVIFDTKNNSGNGTVYGDVTISDDVKIPAGKKLTVPSGKSLTIPKGMSMAMLDGSALTIETGAKLTIEADGTFDASNGTVENKGTIVNEGAMDAGTKGKIVNSGTILNKGEMGAADGTIENSGTIDNEADAKLDATAGKIVNTGTINNKGTMDAAGDAIDNKGKIVNDGTLNLPEGTSVNIIKALKLSGSGKVMAGEKEYSNDGTPTDGGGGDDDDPIIVNDDPVSADAVITIDDLEIPGAEDIDTANQSMPLTSSDLISEVAPTLDGAVDDMPGSTTAGSKTIKVEAAVSALGSVGISVATKDVDTVVVRMPIRKNMITPSSGKTDTLIMFADLQPSDLVSSDTPINVSDIKVIKVKSADSALPVPAAVASDGSDFTNGRFMITDGDTKMPVTQIDPKSTGTYNLIVRVTDLTPGKDIADSDNFDINKEQYTVVDPIVIVRDAKSGGGSSSGACSAGAAAFVALAALAMIKRRTR